MLLLAAAMPLLPGCPVFQPTDTPVPETSVVEPTTGATYWLYVPSNYSDERDWPLVITLHGTIPWDTRTAQIKEWKALAEEKGFLVAAPELRSSQGILPHADRGGWYQDLGTDERTILAVLDDVRGHYRIDADPNAVLLSGFSAGGFAMYHTGLRNPSRFGLLIARACNGDVGMMQELVPVTEPAKRMPILLYWGKDEAVISTQSWQTFEYLRTHGYKRAKVQQVAGGHLRRPELAYRLWSSTCLPARHRQ
jgi:poly(3-hydroxybutyrate) depolymerase